MRPQQVSKVAMYSIALMALTTIHHIYGAIIYDTPWRLHVLIISIPVIVLTVALRKLLLSRTGMGKTIVFWILMAITLIPSLILIGVYEGLYNHVLKTLSSSQEQVSTRFNLCFQRQNMRYRMI